MNMVSNVDIALIFVDQTVTYTLTNDDEGHFGVDSDGNLYKASNKTNFETSKSHKITVKIADNGSPSMSVSFSWQIAGIMELWSYLILHSHGHS